VLGVDIAEAVVEAARPTMPAGVELRAGDVEDLDLEDDSFDVVVCFETIEHVRDRDAALGELWRVLAPGGVLAISSPNRDAYVAGNPHHIFEYSPEELRAALAERFAHVRLFRQQGLIGCAVLDDGAGVGAGPLPGLEATVAQPGAAGDETYVLALASNEPLPDTDPVMVTTGLVEVRRWVELYQEQQEVLRRQHEHIQNAQLQYEEIQEIRGRLRDAEQELAVIPDLEQDAQITRAEHERLFLLERERPELLARIAELEERADRADRLERVNRGLESSLSWRITKPLRRLKNLR
jgi:SAM-dependent methyltransferase